MTTRRTEHGAALVIVLAFVVLLTAVSIAFFNRATATRTIAQATSRGWEADQLALSGLSAVVGDFKEEIRSGSTMTSPSATPLYAPSTSQNIVPQRSGNPLGAPEPVPNLIRRSVHSDRIAPPGVPSLASDVNSSSDPALDGRTVSTARWNRHYLIPKLVLTNDDYDPVAAFTAPDWIIVKRSGPAVETSIGSGDTALNNAVATNSNFVIGRYSYAVYDEGGLLDLNVAGYPVPSPTPATYKPDIGRKGVVAFADLTALPTTAAATASTLAVNRLVGWRNYATIQPTGTFPALVPSTTGATAFVNFALTRTRDFRTVATPSPTPATPITDQAFATRDEMIRLRSSSSAGSASMLLHLATFSRERNRQTWNDASTRLSIRYPLERFDLLASPAANAANIKRYFGIQYVAATPTVLEHWQYTGAESSTLQPTIHILSGNDQDPDLSVLLHYAFAGATVSDADILSMIASWIDQRDTDSNTTWIEYGDAAAPSKAWGADGNPPTLATDPRPSPSPVVINRSFRNVGELGYGYHNGATKINFATVGTDARLLDLFTYNTAGVRAGTVNLNTHNASVVAALLKSALVTDGGTTVVSTANANAAANAIVAEAIARPALSREDVARFASVVTTSPFSSGVEQREIVSRVLAEVGQTRTWNLLIDLVAQSGRYPQTATNLPQFVVEGERHYWLHVSLDRFNGDVIDQYLEAVTE